VRARGGNDALFAMIPISSGAFQASFASVKASAAIECTAQCRQHAQRT
jgi:hypothetical protein